MTREQQKEVIAHRKSNADYQGSWSGKPGSPPNSKRGSVDRSIVSSMIAEHEAKRRKEDDKRSALKESLIEEVKGIISSQMATVLANTGNGKKTLRRSVASVNAEVEPSNLEAKAELCATSMLKKFNAMGSKVGGKLGAKSG